MTAADPPAPFADTFYNEDGEECHDTCGEPLDECPCTCSECGEGIRECSCPDGFSE